MKLGFVIAGLLLAAPCAAAAEPTAALQPAPFASAGSFSGGLLDDGVRMSGVRFGTHDGFNRIVLDFAPDGATGAALLPDGQLAQHPVYEVRYFEFPYRLTLRIPGVRFDGSAQVQTKPALPFSVVTDADGLLLELQVFLSGPSLFKVTEIDDPAKLAVDVRPASGTSVPAVFAVQVMDPQTPDEAFSLLSNGPWPSGFEPSALVLGETVVLEQAFTSSVAAATMQARLDEMGYSSIINERRGDELPRV